jgi:hypothetical protein
MATCIELGSGGFVAHVFAPCHFAGILAEMRPCNMALLHGYGEVWRLGRRRR